MGGCIGRGYKAPWVVSVITRYIPTLLPSNQGMGVRSLDSLKSGFYVHKGFGAFTFLVVDIVNIWFAYWGKHPSFSGFE